MKIRVGLGILLWGALVCADPLVNPPTCAQTVSSLRAESAKFKYVYHAEQYRSVLERLASGAGKVQFRLGPREVLVATVRGPDVVVEHQLDDKLLSRGSVRRALMPMNNGLSYFFFDAQLQEINESLLVRWPNSGGLIPAFALERAGIVPISELGSSANDLATLLPLAAAGLEPGTLSRIKLTSITNSESMEHYLDAFRHWKAETGFSYPEREDLDAFLQGIKTVRYARRIAEITGHRVESITFDAWERSPVYRQFVDALIDENLIRLEILFPDVVLELKPSER